MSRPSILAWCYSFRPHIVTIVLSNFCIAGKLSWTVAVSNEERFCHRNKITWSCATEMSVARWSGLLPNAFPCWYMHGGMDSSENNLLQYRPECQKRLKQQQHKLWHLPASRTRACQSACSWIDFSGASCILCMRYPMSVNLRARCTTCSLDKPTRAVFLSTMSMVTFPTRSTEGL